MNIKAEIRDAVPLFPEFRFAEPVNWTISEGENWAVVGPNGAGKSMLADILLRRIPLKEGIISLNTREGRSPYDAVKFIGFRDIYSIVDTREAYYQQRWNADGREATPLASSLFPDGIPDTAEELFRRFNLLGALEKRIVSLSSGELRKFLIIRALLSGPEILIIDNPFVGLDESSRSELSAMLGELSCRGNVQFIILVPDTAGIPEWVDKVLPVRGMSVLKPVDRVDTDAVGETGQTLFSCVDTPPEIPLPNTGHADNYGTVARLEKVTVKYGDKIILAGIDWNIGRGEKWALLGPNGSGKSTLLSLLYGDNPQAYANRITLFDRRRGTGESIWDIKRRIGYLNSDIHSYYLKDISALEVVLSGFYDTVGLYNAGTPEQRGEALLWLRIFAAEDLAEKKFIKLSFGQQRLVMLARTFVKRPAILILDEPMHGLDAGKRMLAGKIIGDYCLSPGVTLIYVTHYPEEIPDCVSEVKLLSAAAR